MVYSSPGRSLWRVLAYVGWALSALGVQAFLVLIRSRWQYKFPMVVHQGCRWIVGAKLRVSGEPRVNQPVPTLFVANHTGYLDITVLGSLLHANFVAKAEIKKWPIYGWCARVSKCVFVDRKARTARLQAEEMRQRLRDGHSLILFPEGTSGDGNKVLPFFSSLFATADTDVNGEQVWVQPVSVAYVELDGLPLGRHLRPHVAWYGDMAVGDHMWEMMGLGKLGIEVEFHKPVRLQDFKSRKEMSDYCRAVIAAGLSNSLSGREQPVVFPPEGPRKPKWIPPITPKDTTVEPA